MLWCNAALVRAPGQMRGWGSTVWPAYLQALEAYDLRLFEAGRFGRPVAEGTDELLDQAVKALDRYTSVHLIVDAVSSGLFELPLTLQPMSSTLSSVNIRQPVCVTHWL